MKLNRRKFMQAAGFVAAAGGELFASGPPYERTKQESSDSPGLLNYSNTIELVNDPRSVCVHPGNRVRSSENILYARLSGRAEDGVHNIVLAWSPVERRGIFCSIRYADNPSQLLALQFAYQDIDKARILGIRKHLPAEMPPRIITETLRGFGYKNINDLNLGTETRHSETIAFDPKTGEVYVFRDGKFLDSLEASS